MEPEQKINGALIGSIIIIIILIVGGIYLWKVGVKENSIPANSNTSSASLEADVNSIELENIDEGI